MLPFPPPSSSLPSIASLHYPYPSLDTLLPIPTPSKHSIHKSQTRQTCHRCNILDIQIPAFKLCPGRGKDIGRRKSRTRGKGGGGVGRMRCVCVVPVGVYSLPLPPPDSHLNSNDKESTPIFSTPSMYLSPMLFLLLSFPSSFSSFSYLICPPHRPLFTLKKYFPFRLSPRPSFLPFFLMSPSHQLVHVFFRSFPSPSLRPCTLDAGPVVDHVGTAVPSSAL